MYFYVFCFYKNVTITADTTYNFLFPLYSKRYGLSWPSVRDTSLRRSFVHGSKDYQKNQFLKVKLWVEIPYMLKTLDSCSENTL